MRVGMLAYSSFGQFLAVLNALVNEGGTQPLEKFLT